MAIKFGGSLLENAETRARLLGQVATLSASGTEIILVHGGGKSLTRRLKELGLESRFAEGLRVTDEATLRVAVMVLAGEVNKALVLELAGRGVRAMGLCGADGLAVRCARASDLPGYPAGLGFVGRPVGAERRVFDLLLGAGLMPVVASIAAGEDFHAYNVNADEMASTCAWGAGCEALVYLTDVAGVLDADGAVVRSLGDADIRRLRAGGVIAGGMLPKTESCLEALRHGVRTVQIVPGNAPDVLTRFSRGTLTEGTTIHAAA